MALTSDTTALSNKLLSTTAPPRQPYDAEELSRFRRYAHVRLQVIALAAVVAVVSLSKLSHLGFLRATVYNVADRSAFQAAVMPGFIQQSSNAYSLIAFRSHTKNLIKAEEDDITKLVKLMHWVRQQESDERFYGGPGERPKRPVDDTENPETYLQEQRRGIHSACRRFAYILTGTLLSQGFNARVVSLTSNVDRRAALSHNVVEVWVPALGKWIVADPTLDALVLMNGTPASALELHDAAEPDSPSRISFDQHGATFLLPPVDTYRKYLKHIFVSRTNALFDGYRFGFLARRKVSFAHYVGPGSPSFPEDEKEFMLGAVLISGVVILLSSGQVIWKYSSLRQVLAATSEPFRVHTRNAHAPEGQGSLVQ